MVFLIFFYFYFIYFYVVIKGAYDFFVDKNDKYVNPCTIRDIQFKVK